jgi:hypothetical protein
MLSGKIKGKSDALLFRTQALSREWLNNEALICGGLLLRILPIIVFQLGLYTPHLILILRVPLFD